METGEWESLRRDLARAGVAGSEELGRFVNDTTHLEPSSFDERAAMPALIVALPTISDPRLVSAVAGHLRRPWARPVAFDALLGAFRRWAPVEPTAGWHLGDALGSAATLDRVDDLLAVCRDTAYGTSRQMAVAALARFKRSPDVAPALLELISDEDVGLHAMSALRRVLGPASALPHLEALEQERRGTRLGEQAAKQARKVRRSLGS